MDHTTTRVKPEPTALFRWSALVLVSFAMFGNYYIYDSISPLADMLATQLKFTDSDIGWLQGIYSLPNIFMVLIGGLMIDRIGTKKAALIFSMLCMIGALFTVIKGELLWMATGRLIFGLGAESLIVAVTTIIARWFKGKELSFAFGLNLTIARLGTFAALNSPSWAKPMYETWQDPLWLACIFGAISVLSVLIYYLLDKAAERKYALPREDNQEKVVLKDIFKFNISFWFITLLCVTFYSGIFPFMTFSTKFFIGEHFTYLPQDIARGMGGFLTSMLILATMVLTPLFGLLADKKGKRATMMIVGSIMLIPVYLLMNYMHVDSRMPDDVLSKVYPDTEKLTDFASEKNEEIREKINSDLPEIEINKYITEAYNATESMADKLNLKSQMRIELKNRLISVEKVDPDTFFQSIYKGFRYFFNMILILFSYFPNLVIPMTIMGIAFSLIPAVMWPSVALIVDGPRLGTAYGLMTMIQNIGLAGFNLLIGSVNDMTGSYTAGMWIFSSLGFFGLFFAIMLKIKDKGANGAGLEGIKN